MAEVSAQQRGKRGAAATKTAAAKRAFLIERASDIAEKARALALRPRLISGNVIMPCGTIAQVRLDAKADRYVGRLSYGDYQVLDCEFRPERRATWEEAQAAGFKKLWTPTPQGRSRLARLRRSRTSLR